MISDFYFGSFVGVLIGLLIAAAIVWVIECRLERKHRSEAERGE